jgi:uncharacterized protein YdhG (YjbR/CyaY superfamily)
MQSKAVTVDEYLAQLPVEEERTFFSKLRALIQQAAPRAVESMEYGMPTYRLGNVSFCAFNRQKNYLSLYVNPAAVAAHRAELGALDCGKSCIRFRKPADLPLPVVKKILNEAVRRVA